MDKKKLLLLIGALIIAIGTGLAARSVLSGSSAPEASAVAPPVPQGPKVLVAQRALPIGTIVTQDSISFQQWPKEMVQDAYFIEGEADMAKLIGTVVRNPITAGQPVTQGALVAPGDRGFLAAALGPGMRAVTINVSSKTGVSGFIFPGDHVDLLLTQVVKGSGDADLKTTETVLRNLRILATDQSTDTEIIDGKSIVRQSKTVTIEVTPRIAEKIQVAETIGSLSLSLRSIADNQSELERAIASGNVKVPTGASKLEEDRLLTLAMNKPIEGATSFVTGGDVSRFQRRTIPVAPITMPAGSLNFGPNGKSPRGIPARVIPVIRVTRGKSTTEEAIGN